MKIKSVFMSLAVLLFMAACGEKESVSTVADIAGNYNGYVLASCAYFQNRCSTGESITVSANDDGTAKVVLKSDSWGELVVPNARMSEENGIYTLSGNGNATMGMGDNVSSYECSFSAVVNSKDKAQMKFEIPAVMGGFTIDFATGDAPLDLLMAGTYKGYSDADCTYFQDRYTADESVTMKANGDGTLSVEFISASWGTFSIASATVRQEGETYTFSGSGSVSMGMGESVSEYDFTMSGTSNASKDTFSIAFSVPSVMGGLIVTVLSGEAPATNE